MIAFPASRRGFGALFVALMLAGPPLVGCGSSDVERRQADCAAAQNAWQKMHDDLRAVAQDPQSFRDPARIRSKFRDSAADLRAAASKISDRKLKDGLNDEAAQLEHATERLDNLQAVADSMQRSGQALLAECTRAPGK